MDTSPDTPAPPASLVFIRPGPRHPGIRLPGQASCIRARADWPSCSLYSSGCHGGNAMGSEDAFGSGARPRRTVLPESSDRSASPPRRLVIEVTFTRVDGGCGTHL